MTWLKTRAPLAALGLTLGCELFQSEPAIPEQCKGGEDVLARFDIDLGGLAPDQVAGIPCTITALGAELDLDCLDAGDVVHAVRIALTGSPAVELPAAVGDKVGFTLRRDPTATSQLGTWVVRREDGSLLVGGNQANATVPNDPEFFAPLSISVDDATCPELADEESCYFTQHLLLTVDDGTRPVTVTHGESADLDGGYRVQVERATQYRPGDGKECQVDETLPAPYRFLIVALP